MKSGLQLLVIHGYLSFVFYSTMFTLFSILLVQFHGDIIYYKWKPIKRFQKYWNIDASDFVWMLEKALGKNNQLASIIISS